MQETRNEVMIVLGHTEQIQRNRSKSSLAQMQLLTIKNSFKEGVAPLLTSLYLFIQGIKTHNQNRCHTPY